MVAATGQVSCICCLLSVSPGDGLQLSVKIQGREGVDTVLHRLAHGRVAQDAADLRCLHVLNAHNSLLPGLFHGSTTR